MMKGMKEMREEIRKAGEYEIRQAIRIGESEIVYGENLKAAPDSKYLCAYCTKNDIFASYDQCLVSDDYLEIMQIFCERVLGQVEQQRGAQSQLSPEMLALVTAAQCYPHDYGQDITDKVVAICADALRPEFAHAAHQLVYVTGGSGAQANSRGTKVYFKNLYDGKEGYYRRHTVLGVVKAEALPEWAKEGLAKIQAEKENGIPKPKPKNRDDR